MLMEMVEGFESPSMYCGVQSVVDESGANRGTILAQP